MYRSFEEQQEIAVSDMVHARDESLQDWLRDVQTYRTTTDWYVAVEYQRLSSIKAIFAGYQTRKLQCNY